ncbi:hypothetical protein [Capillimicrobium parvum]|uniref:Uncharacterized protein n=1 Tax=Capillimicrobium parvum TaxID=2884022 RepID=A0A9E6XXE2_9ACTN|nr:hypothetical protein [Capillimicrobium parvum]UGS36123.1 hypothetical protein DSM104329_02523 [Capillimicrobium parvum]
MRTFSSLIVVGAALAVIAGCGSQQAAPTQTSAAAAPQPATQTTVSAPDAMTRTAMRRYGIESHGASAQIHLRTVVHDPQLLHALRTGDVASLRAAVRRLQATPHAHISRLRVVRRSRVLADAGVPFVLAPLQKTIRDAHGRPLATVQISMQDEIGFVRYMHRVYGANVILRGRGRSHLRTSMYSAAFVRLPASGTATIAGHPYRVHSFHESALGGEPVTVWILER